MTGTTDFRSRRLHPAATVGDRFWQKVSGDSFDKCWLWLGSRTPNGGYGRFMAEGGRVASAHRWAYEEMVGPVPAGLQLDHLCRNPPCVNPWHLDPVTPLVNTHRGEGHASKAHCPEGHPYDNDNTYRNAGRRFCRACRARHRRNWRDKQRKEATP